MKTPRPKLAALPERFEPGFMRHLDGRTELAQRLEASYSRIVEDAGGLEGMPRTKLALVERFVFLEATLEGIEQRIAVCGDDSTELIGKWVQGVNSLQGLAKLIGLTRQARKQGLRAYVEGRNQ